MDVTGVANKIDLLLGLNAPSSNPAYKGLLLRGIANDITLTNLGSGCVNGMIDFGGSGGYNTVRLRGYQGSGPAFVGTPAATDDVHSLVLGAGGGIYRKAYP